MPCPRATGRESLPCGRYRRRGHDPRTLRGQGRIERAGPTSFVAPVRLWYQFHGLGPGPRQGAFRRVGERSHAFGIPIPGRSQRQGRRGRQPHDARGLESDHRTDFHPPIAAGQWPGDRRRLVGAPTCAVRQAVRQRRCAMKQAAFDYVRAESRRQVLELLAEYGQEARIIAGGQSLMAVLNMRLAQPKLLIDINHVAELAYIELRKDCLAVGAGVRQAQLLARSTLMDEVPLLALAMPWIGHFQTRNRGTVCGSVAHADPSAELPLCLVTLGGEIVLESKKGKRIVKAADFFQGILTTDKRADELVVEVRFPLQRETITYRFREIAMRHGDFAIVSLAAAIGTDQIELGIGGGAHRPPRRSLPRGAGLPYALNQTAWSLDAQDDVQASAAYRRQLIRELGHQLIEGV